MNSPFEKRKFLLQELAKLGLIHGGKLNMDPADMEALLLGNRTDLVILRDLKLEGIKIPELSAKISVVTRDGGQLDLMLHPVYNNGMDHPLLNDKEKEKLVEGELNNIKKTDRSTKGDEFPVVIEYDRKTKEFVAYRPEEVEAPHQVNMHILSEAEKVAFKNGEILNFSDGSRLLYSASERSGVFSDYQAIVLSFKRNDQLTYNVIKDLPPLPDSHQMNRTVSGFGYEEAYKEMREHIYSKQTDVYLTPAQQPGAVPEVKRKPRRGR